MRTDKLKAFVQRILLECEKEGLMIWEVERLPQALKFAIEESVTKQTKNTEFKVQTLAVSESSGSDGCNH